MITKPTLILDESKCRKNIETMILKARNAKVDFRPHFKTHQSLEIGRWYKEFGVDKITVSSLDMGMYFSKEWNDITVAFPVNILEIDTINELAEKIHLNLLIESVDTVDYLKKHLKHNVGFFIKIDIGYNRTGIHPENINDIDKILAVSDSDERMQFKGFLGHAGHSYKCRTNEEIMSVHEKSILLIAPLKKLYQNRYSELIISTGDTPSCCVAADFSGVDEIRPGNFVFFDLTQNQIGSCETRQIAVAMACPVVAIHRERKEIVVYGGGVHFSKDRLEDEKSGTIFGQVVEGNENAWGSAIPNMYIKSLSQEHGIIAVPESRISDYKIGDVLMVLPVHACLAGNLMKEYQTITSKIISRL
jgi:D-serine deaminase-like pyridoxal phosphate-dependent protein